MAEQFDRRRHWEDVHTQRAPEKVSWYQSNPARSLALIGLTGEPLDAPLIDVGGGASHLIDALVERGHRDLSVLDISATALARARERLGDRAEKVRWIEADITEFTPERRYRIWHDRAVFHFLTRVSERLRYREVLEQALEPGGHLILASFGPDGPERCSGLPVQRYDTAQIQAELGEGFDLQRVEYEDHQTPTGAIQQFAYFYLIRS